MKKQDEINTLVNIAINHVNYAIQSVNEAQALATDHKYLFDLFNSVSSNLASSRHYLNVANDITESISV